MFMYLWIPVVELKTTQHSLRYPVIFPLAALFLVCDWSTYCHVDKPKYTHIYSHTEPHTYKHFCKYDFKRLLNPF